VLKALKKSKPGLIVEKRKREDIFNTVVTKALAAKLAQYPTSTEDDEKLLKAGSLEKRHRMATEVRLGEKRLLHEALALLQGGEDEVKGQTGKKARRKE
jgi:SET domain-containing protein 6